MRTSEEITKIAPALLAAQKKIGAAVKGSTNPFFHSKYADLGAVMEACKDALNDNEITVLQPVGCDETGVYVETVLLHSSGEFISERMRISPKTSNNPQDQGSAISYARRYSLQSMVFIPSEDDDAEKAVGTRQNVVTTAPVDPEWIAKEGGEKGRTCSIHGVVMLNGVSKTKFTKEGNPKTYYYHMNGTEMCFNSVPKEE